MIEKIYNYNNYNLKNFKTHEKKKILYTQTK